MGKVRKKMPSNNHLDRQSRNHEKLGGSFKEIDIGISS
jgi:hypothetical protein